MQHFKRLTTLAEDFAAIGLAQKPSSSTFLPSEMQAHLGEDNNPDPDDDLQEGLEVQRTRKMSPGDRAKARRYRQKNKSKISRQRTIRDRKPQHQLRKDKHSRLKGDRTAGPRRRFVLNQDLSAMRDQMKALTELRKFHTANSQKSSKDLIEALERIRQNAQILCRKFAVLEEIKLGHLIESAIPIEAPGLSVDWENPDAPNIKQGGKDGDATDYAGDSKLKGNVKAEDDADPSDNQQWWTDMDGDGDADVDVDTSSDGGEDDDAEIELDIDVDTDDDDEQQESRRVDLSFEMAKIRTEAEDVMQKLKTSVLSPGEAASFVKDMVIYLGGAMKAYLDLAAQVTKEYTQGGYAGQGGPGETPPPPEDNGNDNRYIGKDPPADVGESPEIYKLG